MWNFAPAEAKDIKLQWRRNEVKMKTENSRTAFWNAPFDSSLDTESEFGQCRVVRLDNKKHGHICTGTWWLVGWVLLYVHRNRRLIRDGEPQDVHLDFHTASELWSMMKTHSALCSWRGGHWRLLWSQVPPPRKKHCDHDPSLAFRHPSSKICHNWLRRWRGIPYLRVSIHQRCQR